MKATIVTSTATVYNHKEVLFFSSLFKENVHYPFTTMIITLFTTIVLQVTKRSKVTDWSPIDYCQFINPLKMKNSVLDQGKAGTFYYALILT
jgi:hypothetical protein